MWKWKVNPFTIDAVLIYAQRGHGRRANLFSDFTFALWEGEKLMPFVKAYSGLTDDEMKEITNFEKNNTLQTFGPVSSVKIELVLELAFEGEQDHCHFFWNNQRIQKEYKSLLIKVLFFFSSLQFLVPE